MRIVLQRVKSAAVETDGKTAGEISTGYLVLLGVAKEDTEETASRAAEKIKKLRIFEDENGKTNLAAEAVGGEILVVSQFTLLADVTQNRPGFSGAAPAEQAKRLYEAFIDCCAGVFKNVQAGVFGADMRVTLVNDGPFTLVLDF